MTPEQKEMTDKFGEETKKIFKSCKYAYANIEYGNVWGDFTSKKQALEAARMWMIAFKTNQVTIRIEGNAYRTTVTF